MINENAIKQLIHSAGWKEAEKIFRDEVVESLLPFNFYTDNKTSEEIALDCKSREKAAKIVKYCLNKINKIGGKQVFEKESWE